MVNRPGGLVPTEAIGLLDRIREGRFQRLMAVVAGLSAIFSGAEVTYEHYRGSYGQQVMYTPVFLSLALLVSGLAGAVSRWAAKVLLPIVSILVIIDGIVGFVFHIRGIARKPGGWRVPIVNLTMGPPVFAPLLFALSGYLGLLASFLKREGGPPDHSANRDGGTATSFLQPRLDKSVAAAAGLSALFSGIEATYSHYENNFQYKKLQWSPILVAPALTLAGLGSVRSPGLARTLLPALSGVALVDGMIGTYFHIRGVLRRPGGLRLALYNVIYGPPVFAPMLFAASGFLGMLASLLTPPDSNRRL